ncbi:MAG TPA: right-handed parallel beta-helix repeat-containing protein [Candidatus Binatia bacterium]|jgi:parallel beta-helix repeat protein|nr:right-handed parallel beta-helix repeat-containing protein [Candidatus Binatia bacterium]
MSRVKKSWLLIGAVILFIVVAGVTWAFQFSARVAKMGNGDVQLSWGSLSGLQYEVDWTPTLATNPVPWRLMTSVLATNSTTSVIDTGGVGRLPPIADLSRFYIVKQLGPPVPTYVGSDISTSTTWGLSGSPYYVTNSIHVRPGVTLTIQPGVQVFFSHGVSFTIDGYLQALGSSGQPVTFSSASDFRQRGDWQGLRFTATSGNGQCVLSNTVVQYAQTGIGATDCSPRILNSVIQFCSVDGIALTRSSPLIEGNTIEANTTDGIYGSDTCSPLILSNNVAGNNGYGLRLYGTGAAGHDSLAVINENNLEGNGNYAVYVGSYFNPPLTTIDARSNWWGTASGSLIASEIYDYKNNPTYSPVVNYGNWLGSMAGTAQTGKAVAGVIAGNTVWHAVDSPIQLIGPVTVNSNVTLTVESGVTVQVLGNYALNVYGTLQAAAGASNGIVFTSGMTVPHPGDWPGIVFQPGSSPSVLSNALVQYGQNGVQCTGTSPTLINTVIQLCSGTGLYLTTASPLVQGCNINNNTGDGIYCFFASSPVISGSRIWANQNGIEINGNNNTNYHCYPVMNGNAIYGSRSYAIYSYSYVGGGQTVLSAINNWWGTANPVVIDQAIYDYSDNNGSPVVNWGNWLNADGGTPMAGKGVSGPVVSNTVWRASDSPIQILGPVTVNSNVTLTIQSGVTVQFQGNYSLNVYGTLQAAAGVSNGIVFTSGMAVSHPGDWAGLVFQPGSSASVLSNALVQYAQSGVQCSGASPSLFNTVIQLCSGIGLNLTTASPLVQGCNINNNNGDGIYCYFASSPVITGSRIWSDQNGIEINGNNNTNYHCYPVMNGNAIYANRSYAIYSYSYVGGGQTVLSAMNNWWGTADPVAIAAAIYDFSDNGGSPVINWGNWLNADGGTPAAGKGVSGPVVSNTVWRASDSPIQILGPVTVNSNVTLTIQSGVTVQVLGNYALNVYGTLQAAAGVSNGIVFTSGMTVPRPGDWPGIVLQPGSSASVLSNALVQYAQSGVQCTGTSPSLFNTVIQLCSGTGLNLATASPLVQGCNINNNNSDGIYCFFASSPVISGSRIWANQNGIEINGNNNTNYHCYPVMNGNAIYANRGYAIYSYSYVGGGQTVLSALNNWWGTANPVVIDQAIYDYSDNNGSPVVNWGNWLNADGGTPQPGLSVAGPIFASTVWTPANSPVQVIGALQVTSNATLTIQPGVNVLFYGNYGLQVDGVLQSSGSPGSPVVFSSGAQFPFPGAWQGIKFTSNSISGQCVISNTTVEFAQAGISCAGCAPQLVGNWIHDCSQQGIALSQSSPLIQNNVIEYNGSDGIYCYDTSSPRVLGNGINANTGSGVNAQGTLVSGHNSLPVIQDNDLEGNDSYAVYAYYYYPSGQTMIDARSNWWGTASGPQIALEIYDYKYNPTYSPVVNYGNWLGSVGGAAQAGKAVAGVIASNSVWHAVDSPIQLIGPVTVNSNVTLTVESGVTVQVLGNYALNVYGTLQAAAGVSNGIIFTSGMTVPRPGDWAGLVFQPGSSASVLSNALVQYAQSGVQCIGASPSLFNTVIQLCSGNGLYLTTGSPLVQGCNINSNSGDGIYCYFASSPVITGSRIWANQNGIEITGNNNTNYHCYPVMNGNAIYANRSYAVYSYSYVGGGQTALSALDNWWGTADPIAIDAAIYDYSDNSGSPVINWGNWLNADGGTPQPGMGVAGPIFGNTVWTPANSPIQVIGAVLVASNATLTIQPGVNVIFYDNYPLRVDGSLQALGQPTNRIVFTSGRPFPQVSDWPGLVFDPASTNQSCVLSNVVIEYADIGVNCLQTSPAIASSQVRRTRIGIYLDMSSPLISANLIEMNQTGISCYESSSPLIASNTVTMSTYNGVQVTSSTTAQDKNPHPVLTGNCIFSNSLAGGFWYNLYTASHFQPASTTLSAVSNWWGTPNTNLIANSIYYYSNNPSSSPLVSFLPALTSNSIFTPFAVTNLNQWFSPNGDGILDTELVQGSLTYPATWAIGWVNSTGAWIRVQSGTGMSISNVWDGNDQSGAAAPEGAYRAVVLATNLGTGQISVAYGDACVIDRTFPTGTAVANQLPDGKIANELTLTGTASDANFYGYAIDYGAGASPSVYTLVVSNSTPVYASILGQLNTLTLTNGLYTFRLRVFDRAGNITTQLLTLQVDNVLLGAPSTSGTFFDPSLANVQIAFTSDRSNSTTVLIQPVQTSSDLAGNLTVTLSPTIVKSFAFTGQAGTNIISWNGTDSNGQLVTNGIYYYSILLQGAFGRTNSFNPPYVSGPVTVQSPVLNSNYNFMANQPLTVFYTIPVPAFVGMGVPPYTTFLPNLPRDQGFRTEFFNGRDPVTHQLVYGAFQVNVKAQVLPVNALVANHQAATIVTNLQTESYLIFPTFSEVSTLYYSLSRPAYVQIQIRDPNNNFITVQNQTLVPAGSNTIEWDGAFDAASIVGTTGDYEVDVTAQDPITGYQEVKTANISIR